MLLILGLAFALALGLDPADPRWRVVAPMVAMEQFRLQDPIVLLGGLVLLGAMPLFARITALDRLLGLGRAASRPFVLAGLAGSTVLLGAVGTFLVMRGYALSVDEALALFQADALASGQLLVPYDPRYEGMLEALAPLWVWIDRLHGVWSTEYRPLNSALFAGFGLLHLRFAAAATMAGAAVLLTGLLARKALPDEPWAPVVAAALLAASPQVLLTAMTPYAMTAHLLVTTAWVLLWLRDDALGYVGAGLVTAVAIGLHQVHVHPAIAAPFVLELLWRRRFVLFTAFSAWIGAVGVFWVAWRDLLVVGMPERVAAADPDMPAESTHVLIRVGKLLADHGPQDVILWATNLYRFVSWQDLALVLLAVTAMLGMGRAPRIIRLLGWSCVTAILPYVLLMPGQGHGWGYRYLHPVLGLLAVVACFGVVHLRTLTGDAWPRWRRAVLAVGALCTLAIPLRMVQARAFVSPWADAWSHAAHADAELVVVDASAVWFGLDLVRNYPELTNRPLLLHGPSLSAEQLAALCGRSDVALLDGAALRSFGLLPDPSATGETLAERFEAQGCQPRRLPGRVP